MAAKKPGDPTDPRGDGLGPRAKRADQRARAASSSALSAPPKDERVRRLIQIIRDNEYVKNVTTVELAREWGLSPRTVEQDAAEAARTFREPEEEREQSRAIWVEQVRSAAQNARKLKRCEAEARFLELEGKAKGYFEPQKVEISGSLGELLSLATGAGGEDPDEPVGE